jgi:hypothetical protein
MVWEGPHVEKGRDYRLKGRGLGVLQPEKGEGWGDCRLRGERVGETGG